MVMPKVSYNFNKECEDALNKQVKMELEASLTYESLAWHYEMPAFYLPEAAKFFKNESEEERKHASAITKYIVERGGTPVWSDISSKACVSSKNRIPLLEAMKKALEMEHEVNKSILELCSLSTKHNDPSLSGFLSPFLQEQVDSISKYAKYVSTLEMVGDGLGEYIFSKNL